MLVQETDVHWSVPLEAALIRIRPKFHQELNTLYPILLHSKIQRRFPIKILNTQVTFPDLELRISKLLKGIMFNTFK